MKSHLQNLCSADGYYCHLVDKRCHILLGAHEFVRGLNNECLPTGGELYIGVYTDYWENDGALCRLNSQTYTRTESDDRQQLHRA